MVRLAARETIRLRDAGVGSARKTKGCASATIVAKSTAQSKVSFYIFGICFYFTSTFFTSLLLILMMLMPFWSEETFVPDAV